MADLVVVAELAHDMLTYARRDAAHLSNDAMRLVGHLLLHGDDPIGRAMAVSTRAIALEEKLRRMLADLEPLLSPIVATDGKAERERTGRRLN